MVAGGRILHAVLVVTACSFVYLPAFAAGNDSTQPLATVGTKQAKPFFMNWFQKNTGSSAQGAGGVFNPVTPQGAGNSYAKQPTKSTAEIDPVMAMTPQARYEHSQQQKALKKADIIAKAKAKDVQRAAQRQQLEAKRHAAFMAEQQKQQAASLQAQAVSQQSAAGQQVTQGAVPVIGGQGNAPAPVMVYDDPNKKDTKPKPVFGFTR